MAETAGCEVVKEGRSLSNRRPPRGRVTIFPNWCKGCNLCVEFCPSGVLEQGSDGRVIVVHPEACNACRWCELHCPDFAILVTDIDLDEAICPPG